MDFKQLESFITIAKLKSFSKAADKLFLTQPTISNHISNLEKELDTTLLNRSNKGISLTKSGEILYKYSIEILNKKDNILFSLDQFKGKMEGTLEIASSTIPEQFYLTDILSQFHKKYPHVKFSLKKYDTMTVINKINLGEIDFGIVGAEKNIKNISFIPILEDQIVLIAPYIKKFIQMKSISLDELKSYPLIVRENGSGTLSRVIHELSQHDMDLESLNVIADVESNQTIKKLVINGTGLSFVSKLSIENELLLKQLTTIAVKNFELKRYFYFAYHQNRALSPLANAFKKFIEKDF